MLSRFFNTKKQTIKSLTIPHIPPKVDLKDLHPNLMILSNDEIKRVKSLNLKDGRHNKKETGCQYIIMNKDDDYFAVYKGFKYDKGLGSGAEGKVKLTQNLQTGAWAAIKIGKLGNETECLAEIGQLVKSQAHSQPLFFATKRCTWWHKYEEEMQDEIIKFFPGITLKDLPETINHRPKLLQLNICIEIINEVRRINKLNIIHNDLWVGNIIYNPCQQTVKLIDFGTAYNVKNMYDIFGNRDSDNISYLLHNLSSIKLLSETELQLLQTTLSQKNSDILNDFAAFKASLEYSDKIQKIAVLNLDDLDAIKHSPQKIEALTHYTQIILTDNQNRNIFDYMKYQHFLEKNSIYVANNQVLIHSSLNPIIWNSSEVKNLLHLNPEYGYQLFDGMSEKLMAEFLPETAPQAQQLMNDKPSITMTSK